MKDGQRGGGHVFNNIPDIGAAVWIKCPPPARCLFLLGSLRLHCFPHDIIFCPGLCLLATVHANQKLWFMHLSCNGLNIKFNFAAVEVCLPPAQPWHGEPGAPAAAPREFITSSTICESNIWMKHLSGVRTEQRLLSPYRYMETGRRGKRRSHLTVTKQPVW